MEKTLILWLLVIGSLVLVWCQKNDWGISNSQLESPEAVVNTSVYSCWENDSECLDDEVINNSENAVFEADNFDEDTSFVPWNFYLYTNEDIESAKDTVLNWFNSWNIQVEVKSVDYLWDEKSNSELDYCRSLDETVDECAVFTSSFHTLEDSWVFEPNIDVDGYTWYLGRTVGEDWKILTMWFN